MNLNPLYENAILIAPSSEKGFFDAYRQEHPEQRFDVLTVEAVEAMFCYQYDVHAISVLKKSGYANKDVKAILDALCRFEKGKAYRSEKLQGLVPLFERLLLEGYLYRGENPFAFFRNRPIVIRGYADGKRIASAIESLPNIALSWDKLPPKRPKPIKLRRYADKKEELNAFLAFLQDELSSGIDPKDMYLFGFDETHVPELPLAMADATFVTEKTIPEGSHVYLLDFSKSNYTPEPNDDGFFLDEEYRELKMPDSKERERRTVVETQALLSRQEVGWLSFGGREEGLCPLAKTSEAVEI